MAAPYGPPETLPRGAPRHDRHRRRGVVGPLVLIFLGGVFLLQNTGYLPPNAWANLWRLWPILLVLGGLELLFANRVPWLVLAGVATIVLIVGVAATLISVPGMGSSPPIVSRSFDTNLDGATQASATIRFGAGELNVGPLVDTPATLLARMTYDGPSELTPEVRYSAIGPTGQLEYQISGRGGPGWLPFAGGASNSVRMDVNLSPNVPITSLIVQTGATEAHLDLSSLKVANLDVSVGAASTWIRLPERAGTTTAHVAGGAASITLEIPQGAAAQIRHRGGLSTVNVDTNRFPAAGDNLYRSANYDTAQNKIDINLETGVTTIQVN